MQLRVQPHNIEAEQSVLGSIMLEPEKWDEVNDTISEEHFYKNAHRTIYSTFRELNIKGQPIDILTVSELLKKKDELDQVGGSAYLAEILNQTPTTANLKSYVEIVAEKAILRKLITECQGLVGKAYDGDYEDIGTFLDNAESKIFSIAEKKKVDGLIPANEILKLNMQRIDELYNSGGAAITGVSSGFTELDKMTAGFQPGELTIIAARPSMGKTAFSLNIATHAAIREGKKVAYFSLEMGQEQLMLRMLASESKIDMSLMRVGKIPDSSWPKLINTVSIISKSGMFIDETSGISPFEIRAKCRRLKATHGLDLIMVDYLQLMDLKQKVESRERAVSEISKTLKAIAKELKVPVIALAQLNRGVEGRSDRRPMLSDLRESGSIEQDADVIMMIYRDDYYERENSDAKGIAEIIIGKQRNGPTGVAKLAWLSQYGQFANLAAESLAQFSQPPKEDKYPAKPKGPLQNFAPES
ncbi:MAG: replicative DNA helicase [Bdellovibrionota bacterium]